MKHPSFRRVQGGNFYRFKPSVDIYSHLMLRLVEFRKKFFFLLVVSLEIPYHSELSTGCVETLEVTFQI